MGEPLAERLRHREHLVSVARAYVDRLGSRLPVVAAAVVGSVARGDFNVWSDVDVIVIAEGLPARLPERSEILSEGAPPGVQAVAFSPEEFEGALRKRNRLAWEAMEHGLVLEGESFFAHQTLPSASPET